MAKVRARPDNKLLFLDFYYRGVRCREQTALPDTSENRRRVQTLMIRNEKEIKHGLFDYAATFPSSQKAAQFSSPASGNGAAPGVSTTMQAAASATATPSTPPTPTFSEFSITWRSEMAPQWRRLHRQSVDAIFDAHLLPAFGDKPHATITKSDVLAFRAKLAELPGRGNKTLAPSSC